jgi:hypothetical protein
MTFSNYALPPMVTQQQIHDYREWLRKNENDDFQYFSKIRELDKVIILAHDAILMEQYQAPKFGSIWENI